MIKWIVKHDQVNNANSAIIFYINHWSVRIYQSGLIDQSGRGGAVCLVWVEADGWTLTLLSIWTEKYWIVLNSNVTLYCIREQRSRSGLCDSHKELACSLVRRRLATAQAELTQTNYLMFINTNTQSNKFPNVYQMRRFIKCFVIDKQGLFWMCNVGTGLERLDQITQSFFVMYRYIPRYISFV